MGVLIAAYVVVWIGVSLYAAWLGIRQRQLDARLDALASRIERREESTDPVADAA
jgi:CcmD family protein